MALDVMTVERPEQLKALGHPLRLRVLEMLGQEVDEALTNRELADRLGVDPGHLHFHVRMLLRAGLIERAESPRARRRETPYRAVARVFHVPPELLSSPLSNEVQAAVLSQVERGWAVHGGKGSVRSVQTTVRLQPERALELMADLVARARDAEDPNAELLVLTALAHPPTRQD
jgi:DNA-binding transcriptional ArsR family regulator